MDHPLRLSNDFGSFDDLIFADVSKEGDKLFEHVSQGKQAQSEVAVMNVLERPICAFQHVRKVCANNQRHAKSKCDSLLSCRVLQAVDIDVPSETAPAT